VPIALGAGAYFIVGAALGGRELRKFWGGMWGMKREE
jgi:hypothetical protein